MGSIPVANPAPTRWRPPFLVVALVAAVAATLVALVAVFAWPGGGPDGTVVGAVDDFEIGQPVHLEEYGVWVVLDNLDRFRAFSDDDPRTPGEHDCRVEWNAQRVVDGVEGVYETCAGYLFHPGGRAFPGVAADGPNFYPAEASDGNVVVRLDQPYCNARGLFQPGPCRAPLPDAGGGTTVPQPVIVPRED